MTVQAGDLPLGVGVIGLGVGMRLAEGFARHPDCALRAVCDFDAARMAEAAERFVGPGNPPLCKHTSAEALIDDPEVDLVCVASYDDHHHAQIVRALEAGKHVFAEKPLCLAPEHARKIRTLLRAKPHLRLSTNTILRMSPRFRQLRDRIQTGELGQIFYAESDYNYGRLHKLTEGWRGRIPKYSVTLGGGIHVVDLLRWLIGGRIVEVSAMGNAIASAGSGFPNADCTMALMRFDHGVIAKVGANFGCVYPHFHRLMVYGTEETFENRQGLAERWLSRNPADPPATEASAYPGTHKADLVPSYIDAILGRGDPEVCEDDLFATLSTCFAIDEAVRTGSVVTVQEL